jgi:hypothetical protein
LAYQAFTATGEPYDAFDSFSKEAISPAEARISKHNGNRFDLDSNGNGNDNSTETPGDVWLLPYWMGRTLM